MDNRERLSSETPARLPLQVGELLAYSEGVADPDVAHRLLNDPAMLAEVAALLQTEALLSSILYRANCPDADELLLYHAHLLPQARQQVIDQHTAGCAQCTQDLHELIAGLRMVSSDKPSATPAPRLSHSMQEYLEQAVRLIQAVLQPLPAQPAFAVRGSESRTLSYQAGNYQIILTLEPPVVAENVWQIEGQILHQQDATLVPHGAGVSLLDKDMPIIRDIVDEFGYFALDNVTAGNYTMYIDVLPDRILIEDISLL